MLRDALKLRPYILMVLAALLIRLAVMAFLYPEQMDPERDHWRFAYETGRVARSIVEGHGFGNPLFEPTGPTSWFTPVYPYLLAAVFRIFGIYTKTSALVMLSLNALTSALTCIPIFFLARRSFGDRTASIAGWLWAFFPYAIYFPVERIWETWLSTLLLCVLVLMALQLEQSARFWTWVSFGLLWGFAALNSPLVLAVLPLLWGWICYRLHRRGQRWLLPAAASGLVFLAVVSPWFIRDYQVFHQWIPLRDTVGLELYVGNHGDVSHWHPSDVGPWHNPADFEEYQRLGEIAYMAKKEHLAVDFIRAHPGWFAWVSLRRVVYLWTGFWSFDRAYLKEEPLDLPNILMSTAVLALALSGLRRAFLERPGAVVPYIAVLLCFPLVFYVTHPEVYYLRPVDPFMVVLAAFALTRRRESSAAGGQGLEMVTP